MEMINVVEIGVGITIKGLLSMYHPQYLLIEKVGLIVKKVGILLLFIVLLLGCSQEMKHQEKSISKGETIQMEIKQELNDSADLIKQGKLEEARKKLAESKHWERNATYKYLDIYASALQKKSSVSETNFLEFIPLDYNGLLASEILEEKLSYKPIEFWKGLESGQGNTSTNSSSASKSGWNGKSYSEKESVVNTALMNLKNEGYSITVSESYFIEALDAFYEDNPNETTTVKEAIKMVCFLQVKIPHFCKLFSPVKGGEFLSAILRSPVNFLIFSSNANFQICNF